MATTTLTIPVVIHMIRTSVNIETQFERLSPSLTELPDGVFVFSAKAYPLIFATRKHSDTSSQSETHLSLS